MHQPAAAAGRLPAAARVGFVAAEGGGNAAGRAGHGARAPASVSPPAFGDWCLLSSLMFLCARALGQVGCAQGLAGRGMSRRAQQCKGSKCLHIHTHAFAVLSVHVYVCVHVCVCVCMRAWLSRKQHPRSTCSSHCIRGHVLWAEPPGSKKESVLLLASSRTQARMRHAATAGWVRAGMQSAEADAHKNAPS